MSRIKLSSGSVVRRTVVQATRLLFEKCGRIQIGPHSDLNPAVHHCAMTLISVGLQLTMNGSNFLQMGAIVYSGSVLAVVFENFFLEIYPHTAQGMGDIRRSVV